MESDNKTTLSHSHSHACAACKFQRRKCKPDCLLAPFFPSSSHHDFLAVHKLFGVSNILKTIRSFNSLADKQAAIKSMIFQAKARAVDRVGGCHRIIRQLKNQINNYEKQLQHVRYQVHLHKLIASIPIDNLADAMPINQSSIAFTPSFLPEFSERRGKGKENRGFVNGNYDSRQVFDGISVKFENAEKVSQSSGLNHEYDNQSNANLSQSDKQPVTVDLSEDIKPFLAVFDDRFNSIFMDSKSSYHDQVLLEHHKSNKIEEEEGNQQKDT